MSNARDPLSAYQALDLTEPQQQELKRIVRNVTTEHLSRALGRVWKSLIALVVVILSQSIYIAFESGSHVNQQEVNTASIQSLMTSKTIDEQQLASMNATLLQMEMQLNRIEAKVDKQ